MRVVVCPLPAGVLGCWHSPTRTIHLAPGLTEAQRRAVLEHELEHARHDDQPLHDPVLHARRERQTERAAARRLITLDALSWCRDEQEVALYVGVDRQMVRARLDGLTDSEKATIERRLMAADGGAA